MSAPVAPRFSVYQFEGRWHMRSTWQGNTHTRQVNAKTRDEAVATAKCWAHNLSLGKGPGSKAAPQRSDPKIPTGFQPLPEPAPEPEPPPSEFAFSGAEERALGQLVEFDRPYRYARTLLERARLEDRLGLSRQLADWLERREQQLHQAGLVTAYAEALSPRSNRRRGDVVARLEGIAAAPLPELPRAGWWSR